MKQLREAEAAVALAESLNVPLLDLLRSAVANYKPSSGVTWADAWTEYESKRGSRAGSAQLGNVRAAWFSFANFVGRPMLGTPTRQEVERWLASVLPADCKPSSFNHRVSDLSTVMGWHAKRRTINCNPCTEVDRRVVKRRTPAVLSPDLCQSLLRHVETHSPEWVPWIALMLFGGVRPGLREEGECRRLSDDLSAGREVILPGGVLIQGKVYGERVVPWKASGPLKEWLDVYPLHPLPLPARAERDWTKLRRACGLSHDVLRHTAASAMAYSGMTLAEVALALGNSEEMLRRHYIGRWSREMTSAVWGLLPGAPSSATCAAGAA